MPFSTATQTEVFVIATQLHNELQVLLKNSSEEYNKGFNDAFRKASKKPNVISYNQTNENEYMKGFTFGTALRAIVRRKHLGIDDSNED